MDLICNREVYGVGMKALVNPMKQLIIRVICDKIMVKCRIDCRSEKWEVALFHGEGICME